MKNKQAFTMIEIVVVISMILVASSVLIGSVMGVIKRNDQQKEVSIKESYASASIMYFDEYGVCPPDVDTLIAKKLISAELVKGYTIVVDPITDCRDENKITVTKTES